MNFIEGTCPKCGAKTRENCNTWVYGSPVRICKSCKTEYLDIILEAGFDGVFLDVVDVFYAFEEQAK